MRTARLLTVSQHALGRGCVSPGVSTQGCVWQTPPPVDRMTDTCKNITFPQTSFAGGSEIATGLAACLLYDFHIDRNVDEV